MEIYSRQQALSIQDAAENFGLTKTACAYRYDRQRVTTQVKANLLSDCSMMTDPRPIIRGYRLGF